MKVELLSPVGSWEALVAAVSNGADAVYLGSKLFNARRLAGNFTQAALKKAVQYATMHNVKVYLTLNTLIKNHEINAFIKQIANAEMLGITAVIIQDLSFAPIIKKHFPHLEVHASTQASLMNTDAVKMWQPYVDVFVLARELTKSQIKRIHDDTGARLEVFVHGHLCISYSGQCLISSLIGSRSGNRGMCASSCRKQYNGDKYLLSAKDLCMIENVQDVIESGASTLKMEGRMKSPEYVATVTREYRTQLDNALQGKPVKVTQDSYDDLKLAFNRNFTPGYFTGEQRIVDPIISSKRGLYLGKVVDGHITLEEDLELFDGVVCVKHGQRHGDFVKRIDGPSGKGDTVKLYVPGFTNGASVFLISKHGGRNLLGATKLTPINVSVTVKENEAVNITVTVKDRSIVHETGFVAQKAVKQAFTQEMWKTELHKYESDIFVFANLTITTDGSFVPKSVITTFRNMLDNRILDTLVPITRAPTVLEPLSYEHTQADETLLHVMVYNETDAMTAVKHGADVVYYDIFLPDAVTVIQKLKQHVRVVAATPMVMTDDDMDRLPKLVNQCKPDMVYAQNVGVLHNTSVPIVMGYQTNIFNDNQIEFYREKNVQCMVASIELTKSEVDKFAQKAQLLYYVHGNPVVMTFNEHVAQGSLTDKKGYTFPVRQGTTGSTEMLYSKTIGMLQHTQDILSTNVAGLFLDLDNLDVASITQFYRDCIDGKRPRIQKRNVTIANLEKGVM